jgi:regulator of sigma E protease
MSWLIAILALGLLIALHELGHFWAARAVGMRVVRYSIGMLHPIAKWTSKKTGITYQLGILPLGGFVQIKGMNPFEEGAFEDEDSYQTKPVWKRMLVVVAGPLANLIIAFLVFFALFAVGAPEPSGEPVIGSVAEGRPADEAGLLAGDRVAEFDGHELESWNELAAALHAHPETEVTLLVEREGERFEVKVTPQLIDGIGLIGIDPEMVRVRLGIGEALLASALKCAVIAGGTVMALASLIGGSAGDVQAVGPVGIVKMAAAKIQSDAGQALDLFGFFSMMLCLFNLLPFPALDGGRGTFLLFEAITRRRVNKKVDAMASTVGFILILGLILVITVKEIFFG